MEVRYLFKVLIVDDSDFQRMELKRLKLWGEISGFIITGEARNGQEALEKMKLDSFDLVITDIRMPKVDGIELLIKIMEKGLASCVVFLSEYTEFRYAKQGLAYGAFDYLVKPIQRDELIVLLERIHQRLSAKAQEEELIKKMEKSLSQQIKMVLPQTEIKLLKEMLRAGQHQGVELARIITEQLSAATQADVTKISIALKNIMEEVVAQLLVEYPWLEKYVDLQQLNKNLLHCAGGQRELVQDFQENIAELTTIIQQFTNCGDHGPVVKEVMKYTLQHIDGELSLKSVAAELFINRSYLSQVFKEKTGITFGVYLNSMKMARGKRLLLEPNLKILEIAGRLGYKDIEYFSRVFRGKFGISPTEYRQTHST